MQNKEIWQWAHQIPEDWLPENMSFTIDAESARAQMGRLQGFMQMQQLYQGAIREIRTKLETLDAEFRVRYEHNPIHHIDSRLKSPQSILEKMKRRGLESTLAAARDVLLDIAGVRVICNYVEDVYDIAEMLEKQGDITPVRRRDYIAHPKDNGYRSLHMVVKVPVFLSDHSELVPVEIQFRTIAMDFWASLEHELRYKSANNMDDIMMARLKRCAEDSAALDMEMQAIRNQSIRQNDAANQGK